MNLPVINQKCYSCDQGGNIVYTGECDSVELKQYVHKCDKCYKRTYSRIIYPYFQHEMIFAQLNVDKVFLTTDGQLHLHEVAAIDHEQMGVLKKLEQEGKLVIAELSFPLNFEEEPYKSNYTAPIKITKDGKEN